jgi:hypothetical protein
MCCLIARCRFDKDCSLGCKCDSQAAELVRLHAWGASGTKEKSVHRCQCIVHEKVQTGGGGGVYSQLKLLTRRSRARATYEEEEEEEEISMLNIRMSRTPIEDSPVPIEPESVHHRS